MSSAASDVRRTPLYDEHVAAGARMVDFAGWSMPVQYQSILAEHHAVRTTAGLFDVSHMGEFEISGPKAEALCAKLFTNDARVLTPGRAQYSMIPNEEGGVVDDIIVYRLELDRFLVCVNASNTAKDLAWILARPMAGATVTDLSDATGLIAVQGPRALAIVEKLAPDVGSLPRFACAVRTVGGVEVVVARTGYSGEDGFELFCPSSSAPPLWRQLLEVGRGEGLIPCGLGARDTLRVEAALPLYGHELGADVSPYEVRLGWAVKLNRPDMVGYEALKRASGGEAPRRLIGLLIDGGIAREGAAVFAAGEVEPVGHVTSGTHSPTLGRPVAMALVDRQAAASAAVLDAAEAEESMMETGTAAPAATFEVEVRGKRRSAVMTSLPFCVRSRELASGETSSNR
ncbi:MAG: glycine cleavage system aminomethyltransferase GcvT [Candidatus Binatia bacterium]